MKLSMPLKLLSGIIGTMAVAVGAVIAFLTFTEGRAERIEKQYKMHIDEVVRFHNDQNLSASTLLKNLNDVIDQKANRDKNENQRLRDEVASALVAEFEGGAFDFKQARNLEFDRVALLKWKEYTALLVENPNSNMNVMLNYFHSVRALHNEDREFVETVTPTADEGMVINVMPRDARNESLLRDLHYSYRKHVALLKQSLGNNKNRSNRENLLQAFCWYSVATNNPALVKDAFSYNSTVFEAEKSRCSEKH